ncbi:MAG: urate hydroxylase PuuD, partial [Rhizobiales bacterium]|nr:urate hydroxylase PuuD [Hyphomicrobiales bacterium]
MVRHEVGDPLSKIAWKLPIIFGALVFAYWLTGAGVFDSEWPNLLLRWAHLIAGIAWIGTSFYFIALDFSLRNRPGLPSGVGGEAWEVHGGGFYYVQKYLTAPGKLPDHLIWFKWEAYLTWLSGFLLLVALYYVNAGTYLIDTAIMPLQPWQAIAISVGGIAAGWIVYDGLCRSSLGDRTGWLAAALFALILIAAYGFTHVFSGRGAMINVGAFIGTIMAANVFMVIIPNQRKITAALLRGDKPDPKLGATGKQRSLHNTYLTLPVLLMMVSNHYPMIGDQRLTWVLIGLVVVSGALARYFLVRTEVGDAPDKTAWTLPLIGSALAVALIITEPARLPAYQGDVTDSEALDIVQMRCATCHAAAPA